MPESGLLAYRVDFDNAGEGNVYGYYGNDGVSSNEVFVFRPDILDMIPPIEFPETPNNDDFAGDLSLAAMSNNNLYNAAGGNSQILLFHSDGSLMNLRIQNVTEHDGYITFEVILPASINLVIDEQIDPSSELYLWNDTSMDYRVEVNNLGSYQAYYTLDGTNPTTDDMAYVGPIHINAINHEVTVAIYDGQAIIDIISKDFDFVDHIESAHFDYGNMKNITWIITPNEFAKSFNVLFSDESELEADYDYIYITYKGITNIYTAYDLAEELYESIDSTMVIQLISDEYLSDYYGFSTEITYDMQFPLELNGDASITLAQGETYNEMGATILSDYQSQYTIRIDGQINPNILGVQYVYYHLLDQTNDIIFTLTRIVTIIIDEIDPTFDSISNQTIEIGHADIDWTTLITNASDNASDVLTFAEQSDLVNYNQLGTYTVIVSVTDSSGNVAIEQFEVTVSDTEKPIVFLNPSVDSIYIGDVYEDFGVNITDSTETTVVVQGEVNETIPGIYELIYTVTDEGLNQTQVMRYIHVSQANQLVIFSLGDAKTSVIIGEEYIDGTCNVQIGDESFSCEVKQNDVNVNVPSIYMITYSYTYDNIEYTHKRYVFVYGANPLVLEYRKEEEGIYA